MTNAKDQPKDISDNAPHAPDMDAPQDVLHDKAQATVSAAASGGEKIAAEKAPENVKARELRALTDKELAALAARAAQAEHWLDVAKRSQAEFENARKRMQREVDDSARYAAGALAKEMLGAIDNLDRALAAAETNRDVETLCAGVRMISQMLMTAFDKLGVRPIDAHGKPFDPAEHEAMMTTKDPKLDDNVVAQVFERGWKIHDRVLRPAKVVVNKK